MKTTTQRNGSIVMFLAAGMVGTVGCTEYRFYFDCDKNINTAVFKTEGAPLDIDILAVTDDEIKKSPELEKMSGKDWFAQGQLENLVDRDRIWRVRGLVGGDTLRRVYEVKVTHRSPISSGSRIIFFANFDQPAGSKGAEKMKDRDLIGPLTWMPHDYLITVGPQTIDVVDGKYEGEARMEKWDVERLDKSKKKESK